MGDKTGTAEAPAAVQGPEAEADETNIRHLPTTNRGSSNRGSRDVDA